MQRRLGTVVVGFGYSLGLVGVVIAVIRLITPESTMFNEGARLPLVLAGASSSLPAMG